ncbi:hypothetical protein DdX_13475 [Ditylenchus destructor]|uniref:Uncharacterized protein n=1 Tax=Ditylenchus destructor TaxID=166010 RepID=A0AAD4MWI9_9BILA|nr:hypothetical protein DdX_13475 [Ditylenchus destructor]
MTPMQCLEALLKTGTEGNGFISRQLCICTFIGRRDINELLKLPVVILEVTLSSSHLSESASKAPAFQPLFDCLMKT